MKIVRAGRGDTDIFSAEELARGGCCFFTEDKSCRYFFGIDGREATLFAQSPRYIDEAIDEFFFYSGFVTRVKDPFGRELARRDAVLEPLEIDKIQPSQFYINERKLEECKEWIKSPGDVMIPAAQIGGRTVALDGHTRLRAALDLGYETAYVYADDCGEYIDFFVGEAVKRGILRVRDMEIVSDEQYSVKWYKFCDDYFGKL